MNYQNTLDFAQSQDEQDPISRYREQFFFPVINDKQVLYFTGNSLGLQPKSAKDYIQQELDDWAQWGVEGHFHAKNPWVSYHEILTPAMAKIAGANESEVVWG